MTALVTVAANEKERARVSLRTPFGKLNRLTVVFYDPGRCSANEFVLPVGSLKSADKLEGKPKKEGKTQLERVAARRHEGPDSRRGRCT
jgi:hypothetical protein